MKITKKNIFKSSIVSILILVSAWLWIQYLDVKGPGVPVLLYHGVDTNCSQNKYTLDTEVFEQQLRWLKNQGYSTILPSEIKKQEFNYNPAKTVILTFDDGNLNNYTIVYPLLKKYGYTGVFFIVTSMIDHRKIISAEQLKEMAVNGMEIGSHTISHPFLDTLGENEIVRQLKQSKQKLETITGADVISLAPPGGWFNTKTIINARQQGYEFIFSCEIGLNDLTQKPFVYKRIEVLRNMSLAKFKDLLIPSRAFGYKIKQSLKFVLHWLIGTENYVKLAHAI